jgi:hypothetical protein
MPVTEHKTSQPGVTARKCIDNPVWYIFRGTEYLGSVKLLHNGWEARPAADSGLTERIFNMYDAAVEYLAGGELLYAGRRAGYMTRYQLEQAGYRQCQGCGFYMQAPAGREKCIDCEK